MPAQAATTRVNVVVPAAIEAAFRAEVFARKGMRKGNISEAITEAIRLWLESDGGNPDLARREPRRIETPVPPQRRRTPQEAAIARMSAADRMELAYKLSRFTRS